eukprot:1015941-Pyramimonas_sp.AAC.1
MLTIESSRETVKLRTAATMVPAPCSLCRVLTKSFSCRNSNKTFRGELSSSVVKWLSKGQTDRFHLRRLLLGVLENLASMYENV